MKKLLLIGLLCSSCGPQGTPGTNGSSCTVSSIAPSTTLLSGGSLIQCTDGTQSLLVNGTIVEPVQFCPGATTYPSEFNEVGFCIQGNLYAVYSQNGGFLSEIPVGYYGSDGINASCNFTVLANCGISN